MVQVPLPKMIILTFRTRTLSRALLLRFSLSKMNHVNLVFALNLVTSRLLNLMPRRAIAVHLVTRRRTNGQLPMKVKFLRHGSHTVLTLLMNIVRSSRSSHLMIKVIVIIMVIKLFTSFPLAPLLILNIRVITRVIRRVLRTRLLKSKNLLFLMSGLRLRMKSGKPLWSLLMRSRGTRLTRHLVAVARTLKIGRVLAITLTRL